MGQNKAISILVSLGVATAAASWVVAGIIFYWLIADPELITIKSLQSRDIDFVHKAEFHAGDRLGIVKNICSKGKATATLHRSLVHSASRRVVQYSHVLEIYNDGCRDYVCELLLPEQMEKGNWEVQYVFEVEINSIKKTYTSAPSLLFMIN